MKADKHAAESATGLHTEGHKKMKAEDSESRRSGSARVDQERGRPDATEEGNEHILRRDCQHNGKEGGQNSEDTCAVGRQSVPRLGKRVH